MFCKNCGKPLKENSSICEFCGTDNHIKVIKKTNLSSGQSQYSETKHIKRNSYEKEEEYIPKSFDELDNSPNDDTIAILKQSYFGSVTSDSGLQKNYIKLTAKRLYVKGRVISSKTNTLKDVEFDTKDIAIPLHQVTGVEISRLSFVGRKVRASLFFIIGVIAAFIFITNIEKRHPNDVTTVISFVAMFFSFVASIMELVYIARFGKRVFVIHHYGGPTKVLVRWYAESELNEFRRKLMASIDRY